jgi:hypothetical protein
MSTKTKSIIKEKVNTEPQRFRFCCRCVRMTLMLNNSCCFCNGKFVVASLTDDFKIRRKENAESY